MFIKISAEWNKTIISLAIVLSLLLSIYVLSDPVGSAKLLFKLYDSLTTLFEPTYMYGSFSVLIFLIFIAISKYGDIKMGKNRNHDFSDWGLNPIYSKNSRYSYYSEPSTNSDNNIQRNTGYSQVDLFQKFLVNL